MEIEEQEENKRQLEEAKEELWKKWRQRKGKMMIEWKEVGRNENLEKKLEKIETELTKYKEELQKEEKRTNQEKKKIKEEHSER